MIESNEQPYVGPLVTSWDLAIEPKAGHLDRRIVVDTPLKKAGTYLLSARVADGDLSRIVVGVADTVIVKKPTPNGQYFFVADATSGQPVPNANLEFFGYDSIGRTEPGDHPDRDPRLHQDHGPDGQLILDDKVLDPHFNWLTIARTATGRLAFVEFRDWYPSTASPTGTGSRLSSSPTARSTGRVSPSSSSAGSGDRSSTGPTIRPPRIVRFA